MVMVMVRIRVRTRAKQNNGFGARQVGNRSHPIAVRVRGSDGDSGDNAGG